MSALGDTLRQLADLADAGVLTGRSPELSLHHDVEADTRTLGAILCGEVHEYESHTGTAQVSCHAEVSGVRVVAMVRTDRPWVEPRDAEDTSTGVDTYDCPEPGCDYEIFAVGLQDPGEPDYFTEDIEQHRRGHEMAAENTLRVRALSDAERVLHKPTGRIGRVVGIYGEYATATTAWVAYGDAINIASHFDVEGREDALIADLALVTDDDGAAAFPDVLVHGRASAA